MGGRDGRWKVEGGRGREGVGKRLGEQGTATRCGERGGETRRCDATTRGVRRVKSAGKAGARTGAGPGDPRSSGCGAGVYVVRQMAMDVGTAERKRRGRQIGERGSVELRRGSYSSWSSSSYVSLISLRGQESQSGSAFVRQFNGEPRGSPRYRRICNGFRKSLTGRQKMADGHHWQGHLNHQSRTV